MNRSRALIPPGQRRSWPGLRVSRNRFPLLRNRRVRGVQDLFPTGHPGRTGRARQRSVTGISREGRAGSAEERAAAGMVLERTTLETPKAWGSLDLDPLEEVEYRKVLYDNNLDLLFHRICYWADGRRSLLDIVDRLEVESDALKRDTSISRTSSDTAIEAASSARINLEAVLYVVEKLAKYGYLRIVIAADVPQRN